MLRSLDLSIHLDEANQLLNDPKLRLTSLKVSCSEETAYTVATMGLVPCEKRETRFTRYLERFILIAGRHPEVDRIIADKSMRVLKRHVFPTSEGVVVVLDYQVKKKEGRS